MVRQPMLPATLAVRVGVDEYSKELPGVSGEEPYGGFGLGVLQNCYCTVIFPENHA